MPEDRDVAAFDERAERYDRGWLGRLHRDLAVRTVEVALAGAPPPARILDVGCGTGDLLRRLAARCPEATELVGVDPAPAMVEVARRDSDDPRIRISAGDAEHLDAPDGHFDLVVSTTSFDHWTDQRAGLRECSRVLADGGRLVITDLFSRWLIPTLVGGRRDKARTPARAERALTEAGLRVVGWHDLVTLIRVVVAERPARTVFAAAGGEAGLLALAHAWHARVLADEVVAHAFDRGTRPDHTERLAAYWAQALGGPDTYTARYGDESFVVREHSGNGPHDEMNRRAIGCFDQAMGDVGIDAASATGRTLHDYFAWATLHVNRFERSADDVPDGLDLPRWTWTGQVSATGPSRAGSSPGGP